MSITLVEVKKLITEMFMKFKIETEEMLKQQENTFINIVSSNTKILNDRLDRVELNILQNSTKIASIAKEVEEIKESLNFHEDLFNKKIKTAIICLAKENLANFKLQNNNNELIRINNKLREIEDRSRRNNLRIDGVLENDNESWAECEKKVKEIFNNILGVKNVNIERAHRIGKVVHNKHRTIILKLLDFKDKTEILNNSSKLKGKNIFIYEDYCKETNIIRKTLHEKMKIERQAGKYAYISYDKLIVRDWNSNKK
ncbi:uncharacterized protein LOC136095598 [Hydra vulgaris]|uniref:uncharacterized protein LOC136095598 n=1 Tax=Hydra vulgaris TaxID=6087 RepID=UPI0032EA71D0